VIQHIAIRNFQSLQDIDLDLAPLTVIVGPSSSGKSAFIRAMLALVRNRRGTDFITHGEHTASISATFSSTHPLHNGIVTLTRSTRTAPNSYTLIPSDPAHPLHPKAEFTKLGGDVPSDISSFIGIPTDLAPLAIASQFDKPYLLDAPGTEVARVFGSLTNAHIILNGARESNRQKFTASQTLRTRAADLAAIKERIPEFQSLKQQRAALDTAEALIAEARVTQQRIADLQRLADTLDIAEQAIPALQSTLASIPEPLDIDALVDDLVRAQKRLEQYTDAIGAIQRARTAHSAAEQAFQLAEDQHNQAIALVRTGMQDIASGFETYMREHGKSIEDRSAGAFDTIDVAEAANLAARYAAQLDS
jgi:DNA repair ATPase RecN